MSRLQFIELHEQSWFPSSLRDGITDALGFGLNLLTVYAPIVPLLRGVLQSTRSRYIVDMCSGGGGPWLSLLRCIEGNEQTSLSILLTDKYPNRQAFQPTRPAAANRIRFHPHPVDATRMPMELRGFRTMFTSFHHFAPKQARAVLQDAIDAGEGIGVFEITRRTPSSVGLMFIWALAPFLFTPFMRPFRWSRLLWTYLLPIIPFVLLFDGVVSCLRTYRPKELREIIASLRPANYEWKVGEQLTVVGYAPITYLIGYPRARLSSV